jgi:insertion element IS1 protein InsB
LQKYVNNKYTQIPTDVDVSAKPRGKLIIECDEAWSFVGHKNNKQWIWLALDKNTREIVGVYIGDAYGGKLRSEDGARGLWNSLPPVYRGAGDAPPPVNVLFAIQIFGRLTHKLFLANVIRQ